MEATWQIKRFNELSLDELYSTLQLRSEVFVVEQNCVYQDVDGLDVHALHLLGKIEEKVVAYARLFNIGAYFEDASIGRVVISQDHRQKKLGHDLMREAIAGIASRFNATTIMISAQVYLQKFYEDHQFTVVGQQYLEDGIPHVKMIRSS